MYMYAHKKREIIPNINMLHENGLNFPTKRQETVRMGH